MGVRLPRMRSTFPFTAPTWPTTVERPPAESREFEKARRDAARIGAELASANQFLRSHTSAPGGARALADELEVEEGCELALSADLRSRGLDDRAIADILSCHLADFAPANQN